MTTNPHETAGLLDYHVREQLKNVPYGGLSRRDVQKWMDHPELEAYIRRVLLADSNEVQSIALIDWTTLYHVAALFAGDVSDIDPFVALADFNSLLTAALFYDRIVVIEGSEYIDDVGDALGIGDVLASIAPDAVVGPDNFPLLESMLDAAFQTATVDLANRSANEDDILIGSLNNTWRDLLPGISVPKTRNIQAIGWTYSGTKPDHLRQLFDPSLGHRDMFHGLDKYLIISNDAAALSYENLASTLTAAVAEGPGRGPAVRYVGGVLRSPMQQAVRAMWRAAWDERGSPSAESALNTWWLNQVSPNTVNPAFPAWLSAILSQCEGRDDFAIQVVDWRRRAKHFRKARADLERALAEGNMAELDLYRNALGNAVNDLAEAHVARAGISVATSAISLAGTVPIVSEAAKAMLNSQTDLLIKRSTKWLLRITRPRVWFVSKVQDSAKYLMHPEMRLKRIFGLPSGDYRIPEQFLRKVGQIEWSL